MQLHLSPLSPFARMVRVAVRELDLLDRVTEVRATVSPAAPNPDYARINPLGQVPALVLDDGTLLVESTVILQYLDHLAGGARLVPPGARAFAVLGRHALAKGMMEAAVGLRYEMGLRPEALRWPTWIEDRWAKVTRTLAWLEQQPDAKDQPFDAAGIGLACLLGYLDFRFSDRQWRDGCPTLAVWYGAAAERPSMLATVPVT